MRQEMKYVLALCAIGFVGCAAASQVRAMDGAVAQVPVEGDAKVERTKDGGVQFGKFRRNNALTDAEFQQLRGMLDDEPLARNGEPLPPVVLRYVVYGRRLQIRNIQALDEVGNAIDADDIDGRVVLEAVGPGIISKAAGFGVLRVETGDAVGLADVIVGGVFRNASDDYGIRVSFANRETALLVPGESLYVGSEKRFGILGSNIALSALIPAKYVCRCICPGTGLNDPGCNLDLDARSDSDCSLHNGEVCICSLEGTDSVTKDCARKILPKPKPGDAIPLQQNP